MSAVSNKLGIKDGVRAIFVNAPAEAVEAIDAPQLNLATDLVDTFDYIHFFVRSQNEFNDQFPQLKDHLSPAGVL